MGRGEFSGVGVVAAPFPPPIGVDVQVWRRRKKEEEEGGCGGEKFLSPPDGSVARSCGNLETTEGINMLERRIAKHS